MGDRPILLVVGAASRDLHPTDPRGWRLGGTVAYASLAAARLGVRVRALIGADPEAARASELDLLRGAGVEMRVVPMQRGPVFDNQETPAGRIQVAHQVSDSLPTAVLPEDWAPSDATLLGPIAGELGDEWATALPSDEFVALTWHGLLRRLAPGQPVELLRVQREPLAARANALLLSAEDVRAGASAIRDLLADGQRLLLTHGGQGAAEMRVEGDLLRGRSIPAVPRRIAVDTTGAGDVFLAAWLAARLLAPSAPGDRHLAMASIASSLKVAAYGLQGVPGHADVCRELLRLRSTRH